MRRTFIVLLGTVLVLASGAFIATPHAEAITCDTPQEKADCQAQYDELQKEIAAQQVIITQTEAQKNTLKGNVTQLNAQIKAAQDQIAAKNIAIGQLSNQIQTKAAVIVKLSDRIAAGKEALAGIIRQQSQLDDSSAVEVALSDQDVSSFFADLDAFAQVQGKMQDLFAEIETTKAQTETEKQQLADKQSATQDAKFVIQTKQQQVAANKVEQQKLLAITTDQEAQYQKVLAANQAKAAAISAALFPLRDAAAIPFGTALAYAQAAQKATGVDPALVLAILTQESNLGQNVGQCYLTNDSTGSGVGKNTGTPFAAVMHPTRDVPPFLALAASLGFDPHKQVVSCPIASAGGYGGAMGPSQFIPSTWATIAPAIASAEGIGVANPWNAKDAITAMSVFLSQLGAAGGYTAGHTAAAKYYAGGNWAGRNGQTYANQVMAKVGSIQTNIDFIANNS